MTTKDNLWVPYQVVLRFTSPLAASIPRSPEEIRAMLVTRQPNHIPIKAVPVDDLATQVITEVYQGEAPEEEFLPGWATFKADEYGLYWEGRTIRAHLKDCAQQITGFFPEVRNFRAKFVNRVYVTTSKIHLRKMKPDGTETRYIQVMTVRGPRSSIKHIDYVVNARLAFGVSLLNDKVITEEHLAAAFGYGAVHGMGQERSQDFGRYEVVSLDQVEPTATNEAEK